MSTRKQTFEDVDIDELSARYARILNAQVAQGYGAITPGDHFGLAFLYLASGRFKIIGPKYKPLYRIPKWSDFSEKSITALEAENPPS